ncbi:hypothetical protein DL98DRAFT_228094 [Cadophora sp. DSE1049]|nr:hypothetical protein DL98DRAFT_228094 [Cadophora sp. DSE1049]
MRRHAFHCDFKTYPDFIARDMSAPDRGPENAAVFLPIRSTADNLLGFLVLGLNPRKRFDAGLQSVY